MLILIMVGAGGFVGAVLRYLVSGWAQNLSGSNGFPWGTLAVNLIGCLAIGLLMGITESRQWFGPESRALVFIGLLGGFTTFSTFSYETYSLFRGGEVLAAGANIMLQVIPGIGCVGLGYIIGRWI
ncbi:MAG: fluoride efflux transporter CrcB [Dehalococcoidaceae bacterium]|nr:fluoride efflux transporter CrcB [Dehalococcoidaceae bacterium]